MFKKSSMQRLTKLSVRFVQTNSARGNIVDGRKISDRILNECRRRSDEFARRYGRSACLVAIQVGGNESSSLYVRRKQRVAEDVGIRFKLVHHLLHINEEKLSATIEELNRDSNVDGILLQLPLPLHLIEKTNSFVETIRSDKDVDGHSQMNNNFFRHASKPIVTIPVVAAVREILLEIGESIRGKNVVVLGRSKFVGTPIALMLSQSTQTSEYPLISAGNVTICHRETPINDLVRFCKNADLIISAVGRPKFITKRMIKDGVTLIDVGISKVWTDKQLHNNNNNNNSRNQLFVGDADFHDVKEHVRWITPVPGGVGPVTVACLMKNLLNLAEHRQKKEECELKKIQSKNS